MSLYLMSPFIEQSPRVFFFYFVTIVLIWACIARSYCSNLQLLKSVKLAVIQRTQGMQYSKLWLDYCFIGTCSVNGPYSDRPDQNVCIPKALKPLLINLTPVLRIVHKTVCTSFCILNVIVVVVNLFSSPYLHPIPVTPHRRHSAVLDRMK